MSATENSEKQEVGIAKTQFLIVIDLQDLPLDIGVWRS